MVEVTGLGFIDGEFDNLEHGQVVVLPYLGTNHRFIANYYGGTGNDLVLEWGWRLLVSWGSNSFDQLGNRNHPSSALPIQVDRKGIMANLVALEVTTKGGHSLALCSDGTVVAWGYNSAGQLGDNDTVNGRAPVRVDQAGVLNGREVVAVSTGANHSLALSRDGIVAAWGNNDYGALGDGTMTYRSAPVLVSRAGALAGKDVVAISAGGNHCLVLCSDGSLVAWGRNESGQLGNNSTGAYSAIPVFVVRTGVLAGRTVVAIQAGGFHSLALCSDGTVAAWGLNSAGQLGNNVSQNSSVPVLVDRTDVLAGRTVTALSGGANHSLALCADGQVVAWGDNNFGQLGNNGTLFSRKPVLVDHTGVLASRAVIAVSGGGGFSLATCSDGTLAAWGQNSSGQLGDGTMTISRVPVSVDSTGILSGSAVATVRAGAAHCAGIMAAAPPRLVVEDSAGDPLPSGDPLEFGNTVFPGATTVRKLVLTNAGGYPMQLSALGIDGADAAAYHLRTETPPVLEPGEHLTVTIDFEPLGSGAREAILSFSTDDPSRSGPHLISLQGDGGTLTAVGIDYVTGDEVGMKVAGFRASGHTIHPTLNFAPDPGTALTLVEVSGYESMVGEFDNLTQGQELALAFNGVIYRFVANYGGGTGNDLVLLWANQRPVAWGENLWGQLGNGASTNSPVPVSVEHSGVLADRLVSSVAAGQDFSLALCVDGTVAAWGRNNFGQLGNNGTADSSVPVLVENVGVLAGRRVVALSAGTSHGLALCGDGAVVAWGRNSDGRLGNNSATDSRVPVLVDRTGVLAGRRVIAVSAGGSHSIALCSDGSVATWGANSSGQLGNGGSTTRRVPVLVAGLDRELGVLAVSAGEGHSMALYSNGTVAAWGSNSSGQLGDGSIPNKNTPVLVDHTGALAGRHVTSIAAGGRHSVAACSDGTAVAWGDHARGQLGIDVSVAGSRVPVLVDATGVLQDREIVRVLAGSLHSLAMDSEAMPFSWGDNSAGQLGPSGTAPSSPVPVGVETSSLPAGARFVSAGAGEGARHNLAIVGEPQLSPGIQVRWGDASVLLDEVSVVEFVTLPPSSESTVLFVLENTGTAALEELGVSLTGSGAASFAVRDSPPVSIPPGGTGSFTVTFTPPSPGSQSAALHVASNMGGSLNPFTVVLAGREANPFDLWRQTFFGTTANRGDAANAGDPNRDGESNFLEFCTGQSPLTTGRVALSVLGHGEDLTFTYERSVAALPVARFEVQWNEGLETGGWRDEGGTESVIADDGVVQRVMVSIPRGDGAARFARLKVSLRLGL